MKYKLGKLFVRWGARLMGRGYFVFNDGNILIPATSFRTVMVGGGSGGGGGGGKGRGSYEDA